MSDEEPECVEIALASGMLVSIAAPGAGRVLVQLCPLSPPIEIQLTAAEAAEYVGGWLTHLSAIAFSRPRLTLVPNDEEATR